VERAEGIELPSSTWKVEIIPLYYARIFSFITYIVPSYCWIVKSYSERI
jgi:hypothetical protein